MKKILSILGILIAIAIMAIVGYIKYQNKETIIDLGNGWKSYHHNKIGITVKIPEDAKINHEKRNIAWANFYMSKFSIGIISSIGRGIKVPRGKAHYEKRVSILKEETKQGVVEKKIVVRRPIKKHGKNVDIPIINKLKKQEILLNDKIAFITYEKSFYTGNDYEISHIYNNNKVKRIDIDIPRYQHTNFININIQELYKQNPYLRDVPFEKLGDEYVKIIAPYILKIDSP